MNSTTGVSTTCWRMRSCVEVSISFFPRSIFGCARLQGERVKFVSHPAAQRLIHHLVLLDPALAAEGAGDDVGGIVVAVAAQILDRDPCVGQALPDQPLDHR